jgi:uncharacterized RDD family membrane protein YckC
MYLVLMHGKYGQTLGKMWTGIVVLDISENAISMFQALKREIVPICLIIVGDVLWSFGFLGGHPKLQWIFAYVGILWFAAEMITMLFNKKRRAIHDFIAGSVVIKPSP